jgi:DNA adenine methylase
MNKTVHPVLSYPGNKRLLTKHILPYFKKHNAYVEPFAGSLAVLLAKPQSEIEVVNDINGDLVNFYRCLKHHPEALDIELQYTLNSRQEFNDFKAYKGLTDIQRAVRFFTLNKLSFGAKGQSFGYAKRSGGGAAMGNRQNRINNIYALNQRLNSVCIEHLDWRDILKRYDCDTTLFYCDPPYVNGLQYDDHFSLQDHIDLRDTLFSIADQWVLSYDDCETVRELYKGCTFHVIKRKLGIANNHGKATRPDYYELIITP